MKKQMKRITVGVMAIGVLAAGLTMSNTAYAVSSEIGSQGAMEASGYSLEDMLLYASEDEYIAQAEYNAIMNTFGVQRPFSNIVQAEAVHISLLTPLLQEYGVELTQKDWSSLVSIPETLEAAYEIGIQAEENNIAMYDKFLKENLPADVQEVFEELRSASKNHLAAFQRASERSAYRVDRQSTNVCGVIGQTESSQRTYGGRGQGNRTENNLQHYCVIDE